MRKGIVLFLCVLVVLVAGCAEEETKEVKTAPIQTPEPTLTSTPTLSPASANDEHYIMLMKKTVSELGIDNFDCKISDLRSEGRNKTLIAIYTTHGDILTETGYILGAFLAAKKDGWDIDSLSVSIEDVNGEYVGMWYCEKDWAQQYVDGKLNNTEISLLVVSTMEDVIAKYLSLIHI